MTDTTTTTAEADATDADRYRDLSDRELRAQVATDRRIVSDVRRRVRDRRATGHDLAVGTDAAREAQAGQSELRRRAEQAETRSLFARLGRVGVSLARLAANGLLDVERERRGGTTTIRLGERARKLWRK